MNGIEAIPVTQDERTMGVLAQVLQVIGAWIAPLIIFLVKRESKFVSFHALQALFLQLIYMVLWVIFVAAFLVVMLSSVAMQGPSHSNQPPVAIFIMMPLFWLFGMGGWVTMVVVAIVYGLKAGRGEWAKYPVIGDWVVKILKLNNVPAA